MVWVGVPGLAHACIFQPANTMYKHTLKVRAPNRGAMEHTPDIV